MSVFAEIGICKDFQTFSFIGVQNKSTIYSRCQVSDKVIDISAMRCPCILGESLALVSGIRNVGECDFIEEVESPNLPMVVEVLDKI